MKNLLFIIIPFIIDIIICQEYEIMNYIIDNIYLGDSEAAGNEEYLKEYNITAVVNCAEEIYSDYRDLKFIELRMFDTPEQNLFPKLEIGYKFIKINSKNPKNNILVHCAAGMSRSASLVALYLMKEKGWDYDICYQFMKERRPVVDPNYGFVEQLREYYDKIIKQ